VGLKFIQKQQLNELLDKVFVRLPLQSTVALQFQSVLSKPCRAKATAFRAKGTTEGNNRSWQLTMNLGDSREQAVE